MLGCSVTCVLIGKETYKSRWVHFEIQESIQRGMGLLGIYIHHLKPQPHDSIFDPPNPLEKHMIGEGFFREAAIERYKTYKWRADGGLLGFAANLGEWVEEAARIANR